jgi:Ni/Co efflux regulator RcnB
MLSAFFGEKTMRCLLISVAVVALVTAPAFAQPGQEHEHGQGHGGGGPGQGEHQGEHGGGHGGPSAERPSAPQPQPQAAPAHGGPTNFTNQIQGHQPDQGQQRQGTWSRDPNRPMQGQPPNLAQQPDRGGGRDRGERGPQAAPQLQAAPQQMQGAPNRPDRQRDFGYRGDNGRDFRGGDRRPGNPAFNGPRRDFSGFRDFHRDFRSDRRFRIGPYRPPTGFYGHRWTFGEYLPQPYWARDYWLLDFAAYGLEPPPYGAVWVRVGSDALLIDEYSGEIITVAYDVFY